MNNIISTVLVLGAFVSGFGLTARTKDKKSAEHPEVSDFARMTKDRVEAKAKAEAPPPHPKPAKR